MKQTEDTVPVSWSAPLIEALKRLPRFLAAAELLAQGGRASVGGLWGSSSSLFVASIRSIWDHAIVLITPTVEAAEELKKDLALFGIAPSRIHLLSPTEGPGGSKGPVDSRLLSDNLRALRELNDNRASCLALVPLPAAVRPLLPRNDLSESVFRVEAKGELDRDEWVDRLRRSGMDGVGMVSAPGEFSVRGSIVDLFPYSERNPLRIEFDGDFVDSIRRIDPQTQRSIELLGSTSIPLLGKEALSGTARGHASFVDYLEPGDLVVHLNPLDIEERLATRYHASPELADFILGKGRTEEHPRLFLSALPVESSVESSNVSVGSITAEGPNLASALNVMRRLIDASREVVLFCQSDAEGKRFEKLLRREIPDSDRKVRIRTGDLAHGFQFHDLGVTVVDHHELFHRVHVKKREVPDPVNALPVNDSLELSKGDYVVHQFHGIARYFGMKRMKSGDAEQEFLSLEFRGGVQLYLPVSKIHLIERYIGSKGSEPKVNKLGGTGWSKKKRIVEDSVTEFALKLLDVMAVRSRKEGIAFPDDTEWQHEFEAAFPYKDTPDQRDASHRIKKDMEKRKPMDRLICGDVGYGKTELAMRGCFKAVESGKQVAFLVPTTVLAQQHFQSFRDRMSDYPVEIDVLSRFRTKKEQREILERVRLGHVDILIGTHRILQKDVEFKDLGLVVIDEEQRFGVAHKERLMALRATVDLLTLTATPIPRTLHMALVNLRDISTLNSAPQGRQAIHTRVMPMQESTIRQAIEFELERDGQVFFVHNRVKSIDGMKRKLESLVPLATIEVVHGQMPEHLVEERMTRFVEGKVDVLLATTIIESGLDIPNANTIFINRADRFGLAELHQLRGRAGRYSKKAFAYLMIPPKAAIGTDAKKRLKAIEEFSDLGAGFRIAMRDLEIRGAGNLLGPEQHGHIAAIGYELYCRLLRDAVKRLRGEAVRPRHETDIDLGEPAFLPTEYVPDMRQKVEIYQKLGALEGPEGLSVLREECVDRFGPIPPAVESLFWMTRVRLLVQDCGISNVKRRGRRLVLTLATPKLPEGLRDRSKEEVRLVDSRTVHLLLPVKCDALPEVVVGLERTLRGEGFF